MPKTNKNAINGSFINNLMASGIMKTKTIKVFEFDELAEKVKEKVRMNMLDIVTDDWHDFMECDFIENNKENGYDIKHIQFDVGRSNYAVFDAKIDIEAFCNSQKIGITSDIRDLIDYASIFVVGTHAYMTVKFEGDDNIASDALLEVIKAFTQKLGSDFLKQLKNHYEHVHSDNHIDEFVKMNEYEFRENGAIEASG